MLVTMQLAQHVESLTMKHHGLGITDNDVDLLDAAVLQRCFAGDEFIDPACGSPT